MFKRKECLLVVTFVLLIFLMVIFYFVSFNVSKPSSSTQKVGLKVRPEALGSFVSTSTGFLQHKSIVKQEGKHELRKGTSLQGTDIPDGLVTAPGGDLSVSLQLKQLYDYFYTLLGRKTEAEINKIIVGHIKLTLAEPARSQAFTILKNYQLLQEQLHTLPTVGGGAIKGLQSLEHYLEERNSLRIQYLGRQVSEIFYGMEQVYDQYSLERMRIANNLALSEEERIRASEDLFSRLPPALRQPIEKRRQLNAIREQAKKTDTSIETLFQQRESIVGYDAAEKLQALDVRREQWKERYDYYQQQVQRVSDSGLSLVDKEQAIKQIKQRLFKVSEVKLVNSLDRIGAGV